MWIAVVQRAYCACSWCGLRVVGLFVAYRGCFLSPSVWHTARGRLKYYTSNNQRTNPDKTVPKGAGSALFASCQNIHGIFQMFRFDGSMTCDFTSFSTVLQSYQDDERLIMKVCVQMEPRLRLRGFRLERGSNSGPLDQQASA